MLQPETGESSLLAAGLGLLRFLFRIGGRGRPGSGGRQNFLEQFLLLQVFFGRRSLFVAIIMIVIAGAAAHLGRLARKNRDDGVIGYAATLDTVVVNYIP